MSQHGEYNRQVCFTFHIIKNKFQMFLYCESILCDGYVDLIISYCFMDHNITLYFMIIDNYKLLICDILRRHKIFLFSIFYYIYLLFNFVYVCMYVCLTITHSLCMEMRRHLKKVSSLLPPCGSLGWNSGCHGWWRSLTHEPSLHPHTIFSISYFYTTYVYFPRVYYCKSILPNVI